MRLWIRSGVTRHVLVTGRYAFKIPHVRNGWRLFLCGLLANLSEVEWSSYLDASIPPNPVLWSLPGGWLNAYRRALPYEDEEGFANLDFRPWGDKKVANIGLIDGRVVMIDYDMSGRNPFIGVT